MKNLIYIILLFFVLASCSGKNSQRSKETDAFLIKKKNPLVMPPSYGELPIPTSSASESEKSLNTFEEKIIENSFSKKDVLNESKNSSLDSFILEKINKE